MKTGTVINVLKNGGLFGVLMVGMGWFLLRDVSPAELLETCSGANPFYLVLAALCMCAFISCEGWNLYRVLKTLHYEGSFVHCIKYALVGFFFSSITPSASGGQPMQLYYMHRDQIQVSHSALALMAELASYQTVTVVLAAIGFISQYTLLSEIMGGMRYLFYVGMAVNVVILAFLLLAMFSEGLAQKVIGWVAGIIGIFSKEKKSRFYKKALQQAMQYRQGANYFKQQKGVMIRMLLTTALQIIALYSVSFWVYKAFGLADHSLLTILAIQAVLSMAASAIPLPGAVGVSEGGFLILFRTLFPVQLLSSAMLLSRGISFYLFVFIGGIVVLAAHMRSPRTAFLLE